MRISLSLYHKVLNKFLTSNFYLCEEQKKILQLYCIYLYLVLFVFVFILFAFKEAIIQAIPLHFHNIQHKSRQPASKPTHPSIPADKELRAAASTTANYEPVN